MRMMPAFQAERRHVLSTSLYNVYVSWSEVSTFESWLAQLPDKAQSALIEFLFHQAQRNYYTSYYPDGTAVNWIDRSQGSIDRALLVFLPQREIIQKWYDDGLLSLVLDAQLVHSDRVVMRGGVLLAPKDDTWEVSLNT